MPSVIPQPTTMSGKFKEFHIVCVYDEWGLDETTFFPFRDLFISSEPDFWVFGNPGTLFAYFLTDKEGARRSELLCVRIDELRKSSPIYSQAGCGKAQGRLVVDITFLGKIKAAPLGIPVNEAMKMAREQYHGKVAA